MNIKTLQLKTVEQQTLEAVLQQNELLSSLEALQAKQVDLLGRVVALLSTSEKRKGK